MFENSKFKKVDKILYKGFEIPIYGNGDKKYVGHPYEIDDKRSNNVIYDVEDINKIKDALYLKSKNKEYEFPKSKGIVRVKESGLSLKNILQKLINE
jgi:hypothetical protein